MRLDVALAVGMLGVAAVPPVPLGTSVRLGPRTRTSACRVGPAPDRACSPGAYYSGLTTAALCSRGFRTGSVRHVTQATKYAVEIEYGLAPRHYGRTLEIDHVVPLELGGSNDVANLFPERDYRQKDRLENALKFLVCRGRMELRAAQRQIAADWQALYRRVYG